MDVDIEEGNDVDSGEIAVGGRLAIEGEGTAFSKTFVLVVVGVGAEEGSRSCPDDGVLEEEAVMADVVE